MNLQPTGHTLGGEGNPPHSSQQDRGRQPYIPLCSDFPAVDHFGGSGDGFEVAHPTTTERRGRE